MSPRLTLATAGRVLTQAVHDRRTLALIMLAPVLVLTLFHYLYDGREPLVSRLELQMLIVFPLFVMFLLTAIATVRERTSGTLERLMTTPIGKADIIAGYALAYGLLGAIQVMITSALSQTEFQAVQFMPVFMIPQILLCGLLTPRDDMADWLKAISDVLPLSYTMDAARELITNSDATGEWWKGIGITAACVVVLLGIASVTLRRRTQ